MCGNIRYLKSGKLYNVQLGIHYANSTKSLKQWRGAYGNGWTPHSLIVSERKGEVKDKVLSKL